MTREALLGTVQFGGSYEVTVTVAEDPLFQRCLAGHIEDGSHSISVPLMGGLL